jgi:hypothetical protein
MGCGYPEPSLFVLDRATGTFSQLTGPLKLNVDVELTADGRTAMYQTDSGIYAVATSAAIAVQGTPKLCQRS